MKRRGLFKATAAAAIVVPLAPLVSHVPVEAIAKLRAMTVYEVAPVRKLTYVLPMSDELWEDLELMRDADRYLWRAIERESL